MRSSLPRRQTDMKKSHLLTLAIFAFLAFAAANAVAQQSSAGTAPVHVVVTVEAHKGGETPVVNREDVMVHEGHDRDAVIDWVPGRVEHHAGYTARGPPEVHQRPAGHDDNWCGLYEGRHCASRPESDKRSCAGGKSAAPTGGNERG